MPNPIPDWDLARRIVKFIGTKQIKGEEVTIKATRLTAGIGRERIEKVLKDREVVYEILENEENPGQSLILLKHVPPLLASDAGIVRMDLYKSYEDFHAGTREARAVRQKRMPKKQLEKLKIKEFWQER